MKTLFIKLLKILLPSFVPFVVFSFIAKHYAYMDGGTGTTVIDSLVYYYRHVWPLLFVVALIIQYLIIVPLWHRALKGDLTRKLTLLATLIIVCTGIAWGISYVIWDEPTGNAWLQNSIFIITMLQLGFWFINLLVLTLVSALQNKPKIEST
jgi:cation transport ATPase